MTFAPTVAVDTLATHILVKLRNAGDCTTSSRLQRLCFLVQGFSLATFGGHLFNEEFHRSADGPALVSLYRQHAPLCGGLVPCKELTAVVNHLPAKIHRTKTLPDDWQAAGIKHLTADTAWRP